MAMTLDPMTAQLVANGQQAWRDIKRQETWAGWVTIGRAIQAGKIAMMSYLRTNTPKGRVWSENFGAWLKDTGFDEIDQTVRSRLQSCIDNLESIENWRLSVGTVKCQEWQHPNTVWRHFQSARKMPEDPGEKEPRKKAIDDLKAVTERLEVVADRTEREYVQLTLDLNGALEDSIEAFVDMYGPRDSELFATAMLAWLKKKTA